ncbi:ABC-three component system protein [Rhizobium leguminosarum]|uniref:ABC-three component system protein n=1 Tax=Rhizobium leguminosarum TaxID=384 RepID=UPI003F949DFB
MRHILDDGWFRLRGHTGFRELGLRIDNTASAQAAGYILQLDRALYHLAHAAAGDVAVAVEHVDDIAVVRDGKIILLEQDKSTTQNETRLLGDRTRAIWRTLQIWLRHAETVDGAQCQRYLFFVNRWVPSPIAQLIKDRSCGKATTADVVGALRKIGLKRTTAKVQGLIDDVLSRSDASLANLVAKVELVEAADLAADRRSIANGFGLNPRADANDILDGLFGWLTNRVRIEWSEGRPGLITRDEVLVQSHVLQTKQAKSRFLPRASGEIHIDDELRKGQLSRNFVEHLSRIDAESEDIVQAVDHFLKFNIEKHRLVRAGDVPDAEWSHRSYRLRERWAGFMRRRRRELKGQPNCDIGQTVLADVTYEHRETLDGHPCDELYMTSGHYHRLAEEDEVWWDPAFREAGQE